MTKVLLIAEHEDGHLNVSTARALACGAAMGDVDVAIFGSDTDAVARQAAALEGASRILTIERAENSVPLAAVIAPQLAAMAGEYDVVLAPSSTFGRDVLPRAAALAGPAEPKGVVATSFARIVAKRIEKGRVDHEFDRVVLVAPPRFLGILGKVLGTETEKCVIDRIDKDLTPLSDDEVRARLDL